MEPFKILEDEWARWNGLDPAGMVACASGTAALHLAFEALQLPAGSECIVPDYTMVACARAVVLAGLTPVFVDCDDRLCLDRGLVEQTACEFSKVEAVIAVHVYGRCCDYYSPKIAYGFAKNVALIEDLAEAHGVKPHPDTFAACWSHYRNKAIAGEEGGAVWFRDPTYAALARQLRNMGFTEAHDYQHVPRGHNYRMSNAHARLILESLRNADHNIPARRRIEQWYDAACPPEWRMPPRDACWVYDLRIPGLTESRQARIVKKLNEERIAARHGFKVMSGQKEFNRCRLVTELNNISKAYEASLEVFYLPVQPGITTEESVRRAFEIIKATE